MGNGVKAWSFSALKLYEQCPLKYKLEKIDKVPVEKSAAMQRGIDIHKQAENFLKREEMLPAPALSKFGALFTELREMEPMVEQQWGFTDNWKPTGWFAKDTWLRVIPDVALIYPDNTSLIIDVKSGKKWGDNIEQMDLFGTATFARYPEVREVDTRLWYMDSGEEEEASFPKKGQRQRKDEWEARVEPMFNDTTFAPKPNRFCDWCPHQRAKGGPCKY